MTLSPFLLVRAPLTSRAPQHHTPYISQAPAVQGRCNLSLGVFHFMPLIKGMHKLSIQNRFTGSLRDVAKSCLLLNFTN